MNSTEPVVTPYVEKEFSLSFVFSILQSFILTLTAELGDKTFIMLIILQLKANQITVLCSSLMVQLSMNVIASCIGFSVDYMLYKNLIDYVGLISFLIYSIWLIGEAFHSSEKSFEKELATEKELNEHRFVEEKKEISDVKTTLTIIPEMSRDDSKFPDDTLSTPLLEGKLIFRNNKEDNDDEFLLSNRSDKINCLVHYSGRSNNSNNSRNKKEKEEKSESKNKINKTMFLIIAKSMFISECGDRTQFTSLSMAAIYNFYGVVIGTSSALIITIFLGVFLGKYLIKYLKEKTLNAILGVIMFLYALQIYFHK